MTRRRVEVYRARDGWRWRAVAGNGLIVADSGEAYTRRWSAKRAARRTMAGWPLVLVRHEAPLRAPESGTGPVAAPRPLRDRLRRSASR